MGGGCRGVSDDAKATFQAQAAALADVRKERVKDVSECVALTLQLQQSQQRCEALERERDRWKEKHDYVRLHFDSTIEERNELRTAKGSLITAIKAVKQQLAAAQQRVGALDMALQSLTPGGSEYVNDPQRCVEYVRKVVGEQLHAIRDFKRQRDQAQQTATYWEKLTHEYMNGAGKLERQIAALSGLITWLLGENGEFPDEPEPLAGKYRQRFWWRTELRQRYEQAQRGVGGEEETTMENCPTCESPAPHLHPAVQQGGEVQPCKDNWHTPQDWEARMELAEKLFNLCIEAVDRNGEVDPGRKVEVIAAIQAQLAAAEQRVGELEAHERQTHERLGAILGTDDSLEEKAKQLKQTATGLRDLLTKCHEAVAMSTNCEGCQIAYECIQQAQRGVGGEGPCQP